jgi:hypothetical protein
MVSRIFNGALDGGECSSSRPGRFINKEKTQVFIG